MSPSNKPTIHPAALAAERAEQNKREALFDSVVTDLGGEAALEAELAGPNRDAAFDNLLNGIANGTL